MRPRPAFRLLEAETEQPFALWSNVGRLLVEGSTDADPLFVADTRSRIAGVDLDDRHIFNVFVAVAAAWPLVDAPEMVRSYRDAHRNDRLGAITGQDDNVPVLGEGTFGEVACRLIRDLAGSKAAEVRNRLSNLSITLQVGRAGTITVVWGDHIDRHTGKPITDTYEPATLESALRDEPRAVFHRQAVLELRHFELMARIWADNPACRASRSSTSDGGGQAPAPESAVARPGATAPVGNRTRGSEARTPTRPDPASVRSQDQAQARGRDCLPHQLSGDNHVRAHPADACAA